MGGAADEMSDKGASRVGSEPPPVSDEALQDLLVKTSRTFALAIPQLPQPTRREVTIAYLLFRIADTFEDASVYWPRQRQIAALAAFGDLVVRPSVEEARRRVADWLDGAPTEHDGYRELLTKTPEVVTALARLSSAARAAIGDHTRRTAELMAGFVAKTDSRGVLELADLADLRDYCYAVAGIVGEMLTGLFVLGSDRLAPVAAELHRRAAAFGEGLQLVNILKDSASDRVEGRRYLPPGVRRDEVFALARADLALAARYCLTLQRAGGPHGVVAFTALPVELAWATLDKVERKGPGAKIGRRRVFALYDRVHRNLRAGRPVVELPAG